MSIGKRVSLIFRAKANTALDKMEDPRETLDLSFEGMREQATKVKRGLADVATSRKRLELQAQSLQRDLERRQGQAQEALKAGREDLARAALQQAQLVQQQKAAVDDQLAALQEQEEKLTLASQRLDAKINSFATRKETLKATYTAAEAQTRVNEAFSGISEEMGDIGLAMQRAEDKTAQMQARAGALDELMSSGALDDFTGSAPDHVQAELDKLTAGSDIDTQLAAMKAQLGTGGATAALPAAPADH